LSPAGADFHLIPKAEPGVLQIVDPSGKIRHAKDDSIPSAWFLMTTVG